MKRIWRKMTGVFAAFLTVFCIVSPVFAFAPSSPAQFDGIDVSKWQGTIDYSRVKAAGIEIVYMRTGQGATYADPYFSRNYAEAKAQGLKVGFYHFVTAKTTAEAERQAEYFVSLLGGREPDCLLVGDFEYFSDMTKSQFNSMVQAFLSKVEELTGKKAAIYTSNYAARVHFSKETAEKWPIWVAEYGVEEPRDNGNWETWVGFQYSNTGHIAGIRGDLDRDIFTEDILLSETSPIPHPETPPREDIYYKVQRDDTLSRIAKKYSTTVAQLARENGISNPDRIRTGQILKVSAVHADPAADSSLMEYTVRRGDTLSRIARRFDTTVGSLLTLNGIPNPDLIYTGEILRIRQGNSAQAAATYTVRRGDTLSRIASRFHTTVTHLARLNRIADPNRIYPGQVIELASGE